MKKILGLFILTAVLVLTSCGANDIAQEKASVEFSIPVADILALQNNVGSSARSGAGEESVVTKILVQLKSDNYYTSSIKSIDTEALYFDEDGSIKLFNDSYFSFYADLETLAEEYDIPVEEFFSNNFVEYLTKYEDLLPKYIKLLSKHNLTKAASFYGQMGSETQSQEQGSLIAQEFSSTFLSKDNINFSFGSLDPDTYTVMVDVIEEHIITPEIQEQDDPETTPEPHTDTWWKYTGEQTVEVFAGQDNPVTVELKEFKGDGLDLFDIEFTYLDDSVEKKAYASYDDFFKMETENGNPAFPKYRGIDLTDKDNLKILITDENEPSKSNSYVLTKLDFILKSDSHFTEDGFDIKSQIVNYIYDATTYSDIRYDKLSISLENNRINLLSAYKTVAASLKEIVQSEYGFNLSSPITLTYKGNNSNTSLIIKSNSMLPPYSYDADKLLETDDDITHEQEGDEGNGDENPTGITETVQGSLIDQNATQEGGGTVIENLLFNRRTTIEDKNRYIYAADLTTILNGKTLSPGDSVVFVMKIPTAIGADGTPYSLPFTQLQYELQTEDWEQIDDGILFENNECINCGDYPSSKGYYTFVLPLNFVQAPQTYNKVLFFFDRTFEGGTSNIPTTQEVPVASLDYYIFPASTKTLVFEVGQTYENAANPYRYEFKQKLLDNNGDMVTLAGGQTVTVSLSGTVQYTNQSANTNNRITLSGEIFDNAGYFTDTTQTEPKYFHSMSNTEKTVSGNKLSVTPTRGEFTSDDFFKFVSIQSPYWDRVEVETDYEIDPSHNYQFQCTSTCSDPSVLLIISGFEMITSVTE